METTTDMARKGHNHNHNHNEDHDKKYLGTQHQFDTQCKCSNSGPMFGNPRFLSSLTLGGTWRNQTGCARAHEKKYGFY